MTTYSDPSTKSDERRIDVGDRLILRRALSHLSAGTSVIVVRRQMVLRSEGQRIECSIVPENHMYDWYNSGSHSVALGESALRRHTREGTETDDV